jgi:hypothetical protein
MNNKINNVMNNKINSTAKSFDSRITLFVVLTLVLISGTVLYFAIEMYSESFPESSDIMHDYIENLSYTHTNPTNYGVGEFDAYITSNDIQRVENGLDVFDGIRIELNEFKSKQLIDMLKPNSATVVIFPTFTAAAYHVNGFYSYFGGYCDKSCITDLSFETFSFGYSESGITAQILYHVGYDFLTDIEVDQNPEILENYDTVILLHNEYVTKKEFHAISNHPNLIFLHPNALYAEIAVNYDDNTMTLIRGHNYPESEIANGFDYAIEEEFHKFEYDDQCLDWEFIEIENGFHLNCYPESIIHNNLDILLKIKEL